MNKELELVKQEFTVRDYFAGLAMQTILSAKIRGEVADIAKQAYILADAMLKARD